MAINRDKILQEAQKLVDKKKYDKAIAEYQKVVADDPNDVRTLLKVGDLFLRMQQFADAITTYDRVATFYSVQGFSVKAVAVFKQMREIIQKHAPHLEDRFGHIVPKLAELLTQLDLRSDALAYYDEMAARFQASGRDRDAIDVFRKIVDLDSQNPVSRLRLADALTRVRDFDSAAQEFGIAAEFLMKIGRKDDALRVVERLLQYRQESKFARLAAEIQLDRGLPTDGMAALTKLQIAFKENPRDLETLSLLARAFQALGQPAKAVEVQKEAARIARDAGQREHFEQLVNTLARVAPNDEGVRQLVALMAADSTKASSMPPAPAAPSVAAPPSQLLYGQREVARAAEPARVAAPVEPALAPAVRAAAPAPAPASIGPESSVELSQSDIVVDDDLEVVVEDDGDVVSLDSVDEPAVSDDEPPFALRASYPPVEDESPIRRVLSNAEAHKRAGDYESAAAVLREAIDAAPSARELRERLCDVLIESGDQDAAVEEMLAFSSRLVTDGDPDAAARLLDEVLLLEPNNRAALSMLRELGYAVPGVEEEAVSTGNLPPAPAASEPAPSFAPYDPMEPLPGYDLDELTSDQPAFPAPTTAGEREPAPPIELDDPFANESTAFGIPAYPLEEEASRPSLSGLVDESALEEIEFFATHDMLDEAEALLGEQLGRLPNNPLLLEKKRELAELRRRQAVAAPASVAMPPSVGDAAMSSRPRVNLTRELTVDRAYDIAHALDEMDQAMDSFGPREEPQREQSHQVSVETVFEQFKAGVAAQIAESDAATHYDLGVAYKEMGLVADAIHEFELASRDPTRECVCQSMIGMLHTQNGDLDAAINAFILGLHAADKTTEQEIALTYEIGNAYEMRSNFEQALYYFQLVARIDPSHRDIRGSVAERISTLERRLGGDVQKPAPKAIAVGAGDEFDAAFDDLFNPKG